MACSCSWHTVKPILVDNNNTCEQNSKCHHIKLGCAPSPEHCSHFSLISSFFLGWNSANNRKKYVTFLHQNVKNYTFWMCFVELRICNISNVSRIWFKISVRFIWPLVTMTSEWGRKSENVKKSITTTKKKNYATLPHLLLLLPKSHELIFIYNGGCLPVKMSCERNYVLYMEISSACVLAEEETLNLQS